MKEKLTQKQSEELEENAEKFRSRGKMLEKLIENIYQQEKE